MASTLVNRQLKNCSFTHSAAKIFFLRFSLLLLFVPVLFAAGCRLKHRGNDEVAISLERRTILDRYPKTINDEILQQSSGNKAYTELQERYRSSLAAFKSTAENDCAKLVVVIISPEVGKVASLANNFGIPFILESCSSLNIECIDLTPAIANSDQPDITMQDEVNWSKNGSTYIANLFTTVILKYGNFRNTKSFPDSMYKRVGGDLPANDNEVLGGALNLPYRLRTNAQGLRMDHNISLPKKKQTILFLGNSVIYEPYLDNDFIATNLIQARFPDKEIINAGNEHYTLEDHLSLYAEKLRYAEPDVIFLCTDGHDILNYFFTQRNTYSRLKKSYPPSQAERTFYNEVFNNGAGNN